jgi:hypothetical protein
MEFLRKLTRSGLRGVKLVISDAHEGIKAAVSKVLSATWQRCYVQTIRTQSIMRLIGRFAPAWRWTAQGDDMADLQAVFVNDDALDDELQDGLLVGKARRVETAADAVAEGGQVIQHRLGLDLLAAELLLLDTLLLEACALLGQRAPSFGEFLKADRLGLIGIDQPPIGAGEPVEPRLDLLLGRVRVLRFPVGTGGNTLKLRQQLLGVGKQRADMRPHGGLQLVAVDLRARASGLACGHHTVLAGAAIGVPDAAGGRDASDPMHGQAPQVSRHRSR